MKRPNVTDHQSHTRDFQGYFSTQNVSSGTVKPIV